ncbi:MAG: GNAT family N-acetyltransferase [Cellulomonadaceae bacterium]|nr:GNAT family N-acetyltransferase [Cellulomonadaceae bacterium]
MPLFAPYEPAAHGARPSVASSRVATLDDVLGIVEVASSRQQHPADYAGRVEAWVRDPERIVVVTDHDGDIAGWAMVAWWSGHDDSPDGYYVSALTVAPGARRRGMGDQLLADVVRRTWTRASSLHSVINAGNLPSLALHAQHGFVEVRRGPTFAGITFRGGVGALLRVDAGMAPS